MTTRLFVATGSAHPFDGTPVHVRGDDYKYVGRIAGFITKSSGLVRVIIEDVNGRLFIHNLDQVEPI